MLSNKGLVQWSQCMRADRSRAKTCTSASKDVKFRHVWRLTYTFDSKALMAGVRYAIVSKRVGNTTGRRCSYYAYSTDCLNI